MSYNDDSYLKLMDDGKDMSNGDSPIKRYSPSHKHRSRSRSYDDRRRSTGSVHRSRSPRRSRDRSRERSRRSRSIARLDRELGLKYRWEKTLYVSNIPYETRWTDLKDLFRSKVGDIMYCEVFEKEGRSLGVAAIEFKTVADAERAVNAMHQHEISGRKISCRIDHEGYKTRQAKEMTFDNHNNNNNNYSSKSVNNNQNNDTASNQAAALALALNQASALANNPLLSLLGLNNSLGTSLLGANNQSSSPSSSPNPTNPQANLLNQLAAQLKVEGPVTNRLFVASLDFKVDERKLREVYSLAGPVQSVSLFRDKDGRSRGLAVVEYETPMEALNAVSMFNNQTLLDRRMTVRFDTKPPNDDDVDTKKSSSSSKLPSGLKSIGTGLNSILGSLSGGSNVNSPFGLASLGSLGSINSSSQELNALASLGLSLNGTAPGLGGLLGSNNGLNGQSGGLLGVPGLSKSSSNGSSSSSHISKIFVKNIPFSWDERKLKEKFRQAGHIEYAEIKIRDGKSRGCGLIRFSNSDQANKAVELFNGSRFEGRTLEVKLDQLP